MHLITLRSNDQFNTTVYALTIGSVACTGHGWCNDMARFEVADCDIVSLTTAVDDGRRAAVRHSRRQHWWVLP